LSTPEELQLLPPAPPQLAVRATEHLSSQGSDILALLGCGLLLAFVNTCGIVIYFCIVRLRTHRRQVARQRLYAARRASLCSAVEQLCPSRKLAVEGDASATYEVGIDECAICLGCFEPGQVVRTLPCRHEFHQPCVDRWLLGAYSVADSGAPPCCPLCKTAPFPDPSDQLMALATAHSLSASPTGAVLESAGAGVDSRSLRAARERDVVQRGVELGALRNLASLGGFTWPSAADRGVRFEGDEADGQHPTALSEG